jgi:AcrR family transcriptional regulator
VTQEQDVTRKPGRPRSARAHASILEAAIEVLVAEGYRGFSMEAVAARAGVGKATIYRRWASKDELLKEAIAALNANFEYADTGSLASDWLALLVAGTTDAAIQKVPELLGQLMTQPELHSIFSEHLVEPRRANARKMLERAQERGEIRRDVDLEIAIDMLIGPLIYLLLRTRAEPREVAARAPAVLDLLVAGLRPTGRRAAR